jgi:predicted transcriptional regulator
MRRANLARLLEQSGHGAKQKLALALGLTPPQVSHWLRQPGKPGARHIQESSARAIEHVVGLAPLTLDADPDARRDMGTEESMMLDAMAAVVRAVERHRKQVTRDDMLQLSRGAYQHAKDTGKVDESVIDLLVRYHR